MEIGVGGVDAMADLVQGTTELTVGDGAGDAGEIENEVQLLKLSLLICNLSIA